MSTNYYVACTKCRKKYHVAQSGIGGFGFYYDDRRCMGGMKDFMQDHLFCGAGTLVFLSEHIAEDFERVVWPTRVPPEGGAK